MVHQNSSFSLKVKMRGENEEKRSKFIYLNPKMDVKKRKEGSMVKAATSWLVHAPFNSWNKGFRWPKGPHITPTMSSQGAMGRCCSHILLNNNCILSKTYPYLFGGPCTRHNPLNNQMLFPLIGCVIVDKFINIFPWFWSNIVLISRFYSYLVISVNYR